MKNPMKPRQSVDDATLAQAVAESRTFAELSRRLGGVRVERGPMRRRVDAIGTEHFTHKRHEIDDVTLVTAVAQATSYLGLCKVLGVRDRSLPIWLRERVDRLDTSHFRVHPPSPISDETLAQKIAESSSWADLARRLEVQEVRRELRQRASKYDTSHFEKKAPATAEQWRDAVSRSWSMESLRANLGYARSHYDRLRLRMAEHGLSERDFCAPPIRARVGARMFPPDEVLQPRHKVGRKRHGDVLRRALLDSGVPECCALCGQGPVWQGKALTLQVDHINGDRLDDRFENLRFLCPNCHTQTPTYCGRNIKKANRAQPAEQVIQQQTRLDFWRKSNMWFKMRSVAMATKEPLS